MSQEPPLREDTLNLLFELVSGQTAAQVGWSDQLDAKGMQLFATASVVVGLGGLGSGRTEVATVALILAVAFYVASALAAFGMLRVRSWRISGHAEVLWAQHWQDSPRDIRHAVVADAAEAVCYNRVILRNKGRWLTVIQIALTLEVISVGVAVVAARVA